MPIFEFSCTSCGDRLELLVSGSSTQPECPSCGSNALKRELSVPSSLSGVSKGSMGSPEAVGCCGVNPEQAGCGGPGSCCAKNMGMP
jgi:putative FmdB family regulatory protein